MAGKNRAENKVHDKNSGPKASHFEFSEMYIYKEDDQDDGKFLKLFHLCTDFCIICLVVIWLKVSMALV